MPSTPLRLKPPYKRKEVKVCEKESGPTVEILGVYLEGPAWLQASLTIALPLGLGGFWLRH